MQFAVDEKTKKRIARRRLWKTAGGKFVLGLACAFLLLMLFVALFSEEMFVNVPDGDDPAVRFMCRVASITLCASGAFLSVVCGYRQINAKVSMRCGETLRIDDGMLNYCFRISGDTRPASLNVALIPLVDARVEVDRAQGRAVFLNAARGMYFRDVAKERVLPFEELDIIERFEMYLYWSPDLVQALVSSGALVRDSGKEESEWLR